MFSLGGALHCMSPVLMLWTAPPPARKCQGRRWVAAGRDVGDWQILLQKSA
jgi:hypothetical protein